MFGAPWAHVLSTLLLSALVLLLAAASVGWIGPRNDAEAFRVGALWTGLVLAFEFLAGHFLFSRSWEVPARRLQRIRWQDLAAGADRHAGRPSHRRAAAEETR